MSYSRFRLPVPSPGSVSRFRLPVPSPGLVSSRSPVPVSGSRLSVPSLISRLRPLSRSPIRSVSRSRIRFVSRSRLRPISPVPSCPSTAYYCRSEGLTGTAAAVRSRDQIDPDLAVYRQSLTSNRHFWQCPHSLPG